MKRQSGIDDLERNRIRNDNWRNQPRDPKGTSTGGQWTSGGGIYHGTLLSSLKSILQSGLKKATGKTFAKKGKVYVTTSLEGAEYWAEDRLDTVGASRDVDGLVVLRITPPPGITLDQDGQSHGSGGADQTFSGDIPASWITGYRIYKWVDGKWVIYSQVEIER